MMKSKEFQNAKCEHGSPSDTPIFSICVPQIDRNYSQVDIGVMHGEMRFRRYVNCLFAGLQLDSSTSPQTTGFYSYD